MFPSSIYFLSVEEVKEIHVSQISLFGGTQGIRDEGLLASSLSQPKATFGEEYLHPTIPDMAAAYVFHLIMNHPFLDGNKRTGLASGLVFLELNGLEFDASFDDLEDDGKTKLERIVIDVTVRRLSKENLMEIFRLNTRPLGGV